MWNFTEETAISLISSYTVTVSLNLDLILTSVNKRDDDYGGSIVNRCRFLLDTVDKVSKVIGSGRVGVRLTPFGLFNQTLGTDRIKQWTYLCEELAKRNIAYV